MTRGLLPYLSDVVKSGGVVRTDITDAIEQVFIDRERSNRQDRAWGIDRPPVAHTAWAWESARDDLAQSAMRKLAPAIATSFGWTEDGSALEARTSDGKVLARVTARRPDWARRPDGAPPSGYWQDYDGVEVETAEEVTAERYWRRVPVLQPFRHVEVLECGIDLDHDGGVDPYTPGEARAVARELLAAADLWEATR